MIPNSMTRYPPPPTVPGMVHLLGKRGTRAAVILTAGLSQAKHEDGRTVHQATLDAARPHSLRILGPNCLGLIVPGVGLNASFAHTSALPGNLAFVSQSGGLTTAVLDWARSRGIGFSHFISLGDAADVDFGDLLDYLGSDARTRSILLYIESVEAARKFMSAARAAARNKPVIVVKAGRAGNGVAAAASHTGALAGADAVIDAAIRRAGMLRVDQLVATLARERLWLTDAYYAGTTSYVQALRAAARDGVDVRLLVPSASDIPIVKPLSRAGYRPLLEAGVRVFEWNGTMLHAKTAVADSNWARVGSTNLNIASWFGNLELDVVIEDGDVFGDGVTILIFVREWPFWPLPASPPA